MKILGKNSCVFENKHFSFSGDCLLDSVLQGTWGVFDRDNSLRRALAASLTEGAHVLYPRWREYERLQARMLDYAVPENQVSFLGTIFQNKKLFSKIKNYFPK